jgi:DNA-binding response OmpR family regulator
MKAKEVRYMRLLIVEDHQKINDLLAMFARQDGHFVVQTATAEAALSSITLRPFDVIVTDLMLPDMQGEELIQKIRMTSDVYIIVISAKVGVHERIDVLSMGADDYLTKPFSVEEVMAKLKNIQKRRILEHPEFFTYHQHELRINPQQREVYLHNTLVTLTKYEYDVLWYLLSHKNRIFTRDELLELCFTDSEAYDRVIDVHIKNIRKKLHDNASAPQYIKTHYGVGYQFVGVADD